MITVNGTNGLVFNDNSAQNTAATGFGFKNRIINGDMRIDQRNAGAVLTPTASTYTVDRWQANLSVTSKYSVQQQTTVVPSGFTYAMKITSLSAYAVGATENFAMAQSIEGFNVADLAWGTSSASPVTLSFRVYSSLTGTFGGSLINASANRSYPFSYSISTANTWTTVAITIPGDTTGTWGTTNGVGIGVYFGLGVGSTYSGTAGAWAGSLYFSATGATSVVGTSGATFYITGVQLEKGSTATSFDFRDYGRELQLCQRYWQKTYDINTVPASFPVFAGSLFGFSYGGSTTCTFYWPFKIEMRSAPTVTAYNPNTGTAGQGCTGASANGSTTVNQVGTSSALMYLPSITANQYCYQHAIASAEL